MKLKLTTPLFAATGLALALAGSGCSSSSLSDPAAANHTHNFLGLIKIEPNSFAISPPQTLELRSNDVVSKPLVSGTRVTLLEGLITYEDY